MLAAQLLDLPSSILQVLQPLTIPRREVLRPLDLAFSPFAPIPSSIKPSTLANAYPLPISALPFHLHTMAIGGVLLRFGGVGLRVLEFACAAIVLGIYSYFLAVLSRHDLVIPTWQKAVEGMSGAGVLYTIFGVILTLCLGGIAVFGYLAVVLDILFAGCFAAIAYYARHGANSCSGIVNTPLGRAPSNQEAPGAGDYGYVCSLNTAVFAVSIVNIFLFLITAGWSILLVKHHKKEKAFGPSPSNNYTSGAGKRKFWQRKSKTPKGTRDAEMATAHTAGHNRVSHETQSTMVGGQAPLTSEPKYGQPGYGQQQYGQATNY